MIELTDRKTVVWLGAVAAGTATLWLARRRGTSGLQPSGVVATSFDAYLRDREVGAKPPAQQQFASTSFEAYLRQPTTAAAAAGGAAASAPTSAADAAPAAAKPITILYGTEYGFSKEVAERLGERLKGVDGGAAYWPQLLDMADFPAGLPTLAGQQALLVVCSTQGDGVPPTEAREFCDWLASSSAPQLGGAVNFSVCALGDRSYQHFCRCGRTLDARLEALGGARLAPRADINREDYKAIDAWIDSVIAALPSLQLKSAAELGDAAALAAPAAEGDAAPAAKRWGKGRPYMGRVVAVEGLCTLAAAADKNTVRVELDLGDSGLQYSPGDALGVWPSNCPQAVEELLAALGADGGLLVQLPAWHYADARLPAGASSLPLRDALSRCYDLRQPKPELLQLLHGKLAAAVAVQAGQTKGSAGELSDDSAEEGGDGSNGSNGGSGGGKGKGRQPHIKAKDSVAELGGGAAVHDALCSQACAVDRLEQLAALVADPAAAERYLEPRHVVDVLRDFLPPGTAAGGTAASLLTAAELLSSLRQLQPRLYSISSSQLEHPQRVQATVAIVRYRALGADRLGVCSTYLGERLAVGQELPIYIHKNPDFRLPADPATPIIMVGPGTGLAPFRAFMQERILQAQAAGASFGPCLLYFGCRRRDQDYLYGPLLEGWATQGKLALFTAFSREQAHKVYVQDRLRESGGRVWQLLQAGAHFYVCGDAGSMAGAVERQLLAIIEEGQGQGPEAAAAYLEALSASQRYQRDVWLS